MPRIELRATSLILIAVVAWVWLLWIAAVVWVPLVLAALLSLAANPVVERMIRLKIPWWLAITGVMLGTLVVLVGFAIIIQQSMDRFMADLPKFEVKVTETLNYANQKLGLSPARLKELNLGQWATEAAGALAGTVVQFSSGLVLVLFYMLFILLTRHRLPAGLRKTLSAENSGRVMKAVEQIEERTLAFLGLHTLVSVITALGVWFILFLFGIESALFWALVTFLSQFLPFIGPVVAAVPPILIGLVQFPSGWTVGWLVFWLLLWYFVTNNYIETWIMSRGMDLNKALILFGVVFFAWLWGIIGALVAVPLIFILRTIFETTDGMSGVAKLMGPEEKL